MAVHDPKSLSYRFASFLINRPVVAVFCGLLLAAALIPGIRYLQADFSYRIWFRGNDPMLQRFDAFERRFGNDENVVVIIHSPSGIFDGESVELLQALTRDMWLVPEVIRVDSLSNYNWTHSEADDIIVEPLLPDDEPLTAEMLAARREVALNHELLPGYLVGGDGLSAVVIGQLKPALNGSPNFGLVVTKTRETLAKYEGRGDHQFYLTGTATVMFTFQELTGADMDLIVPMLLAALVVFLFITFRRMSGVLLSLTVIFLTVFMTMGASGWLGIKFNNMTSTVPNILIAVAVADAVHILVTFFQFRASGIARLEAAHQTLLKNLPPTLLTTLSTSLGFFSFVTSEIMPVAFLGILAGLGTLLAWLVTVLVLVPTLAYLPIKVKAGSAGIKYNEAHPLALRYAGWLKRHNKAVMFSLLAAALAGAWIGSKNEVNSDPFRYFAPEVSARVANEFMEAEVGGAQGIEIVLDSGRPDGVKEPEFLQKVERLQDWLNHRSHVTSSIALTDIVKQTNRALNGDNQEAYVIPDDNALVAQEVFLYTMSLPQGMNLNNRVTLDNDMIRLTAMSCLHGSHQTLKEIEAIEAQAREIGIEAHVTGKMPLYHGMNPYVVSSFFTSLSLALVLVSLLMGLVFRSWKLGLLSMIPNTAPLFFGAALMTLLGKSYDVGVVLVASTCLGIAVDDTIHFLANYNRLRRAAASPELAVARVITHTGPALVVTTLILVCSFAMFAFASFIPNVNFGVLTAVVLSIALITDFTLLPAMLLGNVIKG